MIIVQLTGGLGNQLFQYAMGRSLSVRLNTEFKIDKSFFKDYEWHDYSLDPFNLKCGEADADEIDIILKRRAVKTERIITKLTGRLTGVITENSLLYDPKYKKITSPAYLKGYWQCAKYFDDTESVIRQDLQIKIPPSLENSGILKRISETNSVSLHIRRGNYVNVAEVNSVHGTCSMDYYQEALRYIKQRVANPVFYVFSDDIAWAKANLTGNDNFVFIDVNDAAHDYEDLRLMQHCKHHIIANSTFSWWGAWLNTSSEKIVIAPSKWFADEEKNKTASAIIPDNWVRF